MNLQKLKKLNFKQPKYIFPVVILLPLLGLIYYVGQTFSGKDGTAQNGVVTDSINMSLPDARTGEMENKMLAMGKRFGDGDAFTAVDALGDEVEEKDTTGSGYNDGEMSEIDRVKAERLRQLKAQQEIQRSHAENMRNLNSNGYGGSGYGNSSSYGSGGSYGGNGRSQQSDLNDYARELENIQNRSLERQRKYQEEQDRKDREAEAEERRQRQEMIDALTGNTKKKQKPEEKPEIVEKVKDTNSEKFNTVSSKENVDEPLIKAMIDKTTKAREGTRLRFKLLDDVTVKGLKLKKGSYLYGIVTGFGQQRVKANITSILVGSKFIKVNLAVYDNDGMEGFYVPESTFREMVKDASANVANQQLQFDTSSGYGISGEVLALQALQNMYQSTSNAVSNNIRKNKAKIKYNTIVYLINTETSNQ